MKKVLAFILILMLVVSVVPSGAFTITVGAETEGYFTYYVSNGEAILDDVDESISGDIVIPDTLGGYPVTQIDNYLFWNCKNLTGVTIPATVISIGDKLFYNCKNLKNINVDPNNMYFCSIDGILFSKDVKELIQCPEGKTETSYTIPDGVERIGYSAFKYCYNFTSITISNTVTSIGDSAFASCESLKSINIPNSVLSIESGAFYGCINLQSITIPYSVTNINSNAFDNCTSLERIDVNVNNKNYRSFGGVLFNKGTTTLIRYPQGKTDTTYTIPNSVTSIGDYAFFACTSLTDIIITDDVTGIGVTSIGEYAFNWCSKLANITISASVTGIGNSAFSSCTSLINVYYMGSEEEKNNISIGESNELLTNATWYYDSCIGWPEHALAIVPGYEPTCTQDGWLEHEICGRCDYLSNSYIMLPLGHLSGEEVQQNYVAPTCTEDGSYESVVYCERVIRTPYSTVCGEELSRETIVIHATGHTPGEAVEENRIESTCTEEGSYESVVYCTVCGEEISREIVVIPETLHVMEYINGENATCTQDGYELYKCERCGAEDFQLYPALGHVLEILDFDEYYPSCTENGWGSYNVCVLCEDVIYGDPLPPLGHLPGEEVQENYVAPTCTKDGSYESVVYCERVIYNNSHIPNGPLWYSKQCCEELSRETIVIPATGHTPSEAVKENIVEPTLNTKGSYDSVVYCTVCGAEISRETVIVDETGNIVGDEKIEFSYKAHGINSADTAVNSGYITLDIVMNVTTDVARLHGLDFSLTFSDYITLIDVDMGDNFNTNAHTPLDTANNINKIALIQNAGFTNEVVFNKGEYVFATLTFKVDKDFYGQDIEFAYVEDSGTVARDDYGNNLFVDFDAQDVITVSMLGDTNGDGEINSIDVKEFAYWYLETTIDEYSAIIDLDKNGVIDGDDYMYLNDAVVLDFSYLDI